MRNLNPLAGQRQRTNRYRNVLKLLTWVHVQIKTAPDANRNEKKATITKEPTTIFTTSFVSQQSATKATIEVVKNKNGLNINPKRKLIAIGIGDK